MSAMQIVVPIDQGFRLPRTEAQLDANRLASNALDLPDFDGEALRTCTIVASGPSFKNYDWPKIAADADGPIVAVNGAYKLLLALGVVPDFFVALDPQAEVARFIPDRPPPTVQHLVCSSCDPAVFAALHGSDVRRFHVDRAPLGSRLVKSACSVTLIAIKLFRQARGFRKFRTFAWDCCYLDGEHHAGTQPGPGEEQKIWWCPMGEDGPKWLSTATWALEAQDAAGLFCFGDFEVEIVGPGMVGPTLEEVGRQMAHARKAQAYAMAPGN